MVSPSPEVLTGTSIPLLAAQIANLGADQALGRSALTEQAAIDRSRLLESQRTNTFGGQLSSADLQELMRTNTFGAGLSGANLAEQQRQANLGFGLDVGGLAEQQRQGTFNADFGGAQLAEQQRANDAQYQRDAALFGLGVAEFNFNQRLAQAQLQQQSLGLLTSLRGPSNAIASNFLLNAQGQPTGQQVDPFAFLQGLGQPFQGEFGDLRAAGAIPQIGDAAALPQGIEAGGIPTIGAAGAVPQIAGANAIPPFAGFPTAPAVRPPVQPKPPTTPPLSAADLFASTPSSSVTLSTGVTKEVTAQHLASAEETFLAAGEDVVAAATSPTTGEVMTVADLAEYNAAVEQSDAEGIAYLVERGFLDQDQLAHGGTSDATQLLVNEEGPELIENPTNAPLRVHSAPDTRQLLGVPRAQEGGTFGGGFFQPQEVFGASELPAPSLAVELLNAEKQANITGGTVEPTNTGVAGPTELLPANALAPVGSGLFDNLNLVEPLTGGPQQAFDFRTFTGEEIASTPAVQRLLGNTPNRAFGATGFDTRIPGSTTELPFNFNFSRFNQALPSEQQLLSSIFETPRSLGGLGLSFGDALESSRRSAPIGSGFNQLTFLGQ